VHAPRAHAAAVRLDRARGCAPTVTWPAPPTSPVQTRVVRAAAVAAGELAQARQFTGRSLRSFPFTTVALAGATLITPTLTSTTLRAFQVRSRSFTHQRVFTSPSALITPACVCDCGE
jgi:hypothetical protein